MKNFPTSSKVLSRKEMQTIAGGSGSRFAIRCSTGPIIDITYCKTVCLAQFWSDGYCSLLTLQCVCLPPYLKP